MLSGRGFFERGPGARPLAGFQGCPLNYPLPPLPSGACKKNLYLKGRGDVPRKPLFLFFCSLAVGERVREKE